MRTPSGMMIKDAMDASRAWSLTFYSDRGGDRDIAMRRKEGVLLHSSRPLVPRTRVRIYMNFSPLARGRHNRAKQCGTDPAHAR